MLRLNSNVGCRFSFSTLLRENVTVMTLTCDSPYGFKPLAFSHAGRAMAPLTSDEFRAVLGSRINVRPMLGPASYCNCLPDPLIDSVQSTATTSLWVQTIRSCSIGEMFADIAYSMILSAVSKSV